MSIEVLIVEDEKLIRWSLRQKLEERGYRVTEAPDGRSAVQALTKHCFDLIMLDYKLPDMTGLDVLQRVRQESPDSVVIMMTAYSTIETAVEAIRLGAFDYLSKPFEMAELLLTVDKALETTRLRREVRDLRRQLEGGHDTDVIIGQDPQMRRLLQTVDQIAQSGASTVFIRGETGTGKDVVARAIHNRSDRASRPFINITCTALSEMLLESELFGHERGAFTDAKAQKKGLIELADGGTVFLDEIGDMAPALQAKLLRFLEERRFRRVGGTEEIAVDVRVIAATNRDITAAIREGRFREDLYYRLNVVTIDLPPLRARGDDIRLLIQYFVDRFAHEFKRNIRSIDERVYALANEYEWPGNVRELRNALERAVLLCKGDQITPRDLILPGASSRPGVEVLENFDLPPEGMPLEKLAALEKRILEQVLERCEGNQTRAAELLSITRDRLRYRLQKHGLL